MAVCHNPEKARPEEPPSRPTSMGNEKSKAVKAAILIRQIVSQMKISLDAKSVQQAKEVVDALDAIDEAVKFFDDHPS